MRLDFREIIQGLSLFGIFLGLLLIDSNIGLGAAVTILSGITALLFEKGIL